VTAAAQVEDYADLRAPFPWFGGKSRVAHLVWDRFGDVDNYVEPFAGSLAVLLGRPTHPQTETVNDLDCYLANFWRSLRFDPDGLADSADWPVNEADLHARHLWLVNQDAFHERMKVDPDFYDVKIAGWWVWGISQWIGSGWCSRPEWTGRTNAGRVDRGIHRKLPHLGGGHGGQGRGITTERVAGPARKRPMIHAGHTGKGIHADNPGVPSQFTSDREGRGVPRQIPSLRGDSGAAGLGIFPKRVAGNSGMGVNRQLPHLGDAGRGGRPATAAPGRCGEVQKKRPMLSGHGSGVGIHSERSYALLDYFHQLAARLRRVRVCCGDWTRVLGPSTTVKHGVCGVFLDPPYDMRVVSNKSTARDGAAPSDKLYAHHDNNDLSEAVRRWAVENGDNPLLRIALCGYEGEHEMPGTWEKVAWKAAGGYGSQRANGKGTDNSKRERIWFSPHCIREGPLFRATEGEAKR